MWTFANALLILHCWRINSFPADMLLGSQTYCFKCQGKKGEPFYFTGDSFLSLIDCCVACGILVSRPGIKLMPPAVEAQSPNHWTTREVPPVFWNSGYDMNFSTDLLLAYFGLLGCVGLLLRFWVFISFFCFVFFLDVNRWGKKREE